MATTNRQKRYPFRFEVVYDDGEGFMSGPVVDISGTGCFIETVMPLKPGTKVRMTPLLPEQSGIFEFTGEVVRANEYDLDNHFDRVPGMGVKFVDPDQNLIEQLMAIFVERSGKQGAAPV